MTMASDERDRLIEHLRRLHLRHAANNLDEHLRQAAQLKLGHLGLLARIMEAEVLARTETATQKRVTQAHFEEYKRIEDYDFKRQPTLDRKQILDLAELGFIDGCQCVFFLGPSGVGKSHLATGLGVRACAAGYRVRFCRAFELFKQLWAALADDTLDEQIEEYCEPHLLILDDVTRSPRKESDDFAAVFSELVHRRYRRGAMIISSNLGFEEWPAALGTASMLTQAIDRLRHGAYVITFPKDAKSFRADSPEPPGPLPPERQPHRRKRRRAVPVPPPSAQRKRL
jgi:DNA replication protein DnaC